MDTFLRHLQLAALGDFDLLLRSVHLALGGVLDGLDDIHALNHLAEDDVLAIEPAIPQSASVSTKQFLHPHAKLCGPQK